MTDATTSGPGVWLLPESLDLRAAAELRDGLLARRGADLDLDGSAVTRLGAGCLQQVLAAWRSWSAEGRSLRIVRPSVALLNNLSVMGAADGPVPVAFEEAGA